MPRPKSSPSDPQEPVRADRLRVAFDASGLGINLAAQALKDAGTPISHVALSRLLSGERQTVRLSVREALARVLLGVRPGESDWLGGATHELSYPLPGHLAPEELQTIRLSLRYQIIITGHDIRLVGNILGAVDLLLFRGVVRYLRLVHPQDRDAVQPLIWSVIVVGNVYTWRRLVPQGRLPDHDEDQLRFARSLMSAIDAVVAPWLEAGQPLPIGTFRRIADLLGPMVRMEGIRELGAEQG